jgi:ABC-2 type transport system ATP-binding protein
MIASAGPSIDVRAVSRAFGDKLALDGVSLQVESGRIHALLGRNGAGKTTLLRMLAGLLTPTSGTVEVAGIDAARSPLALRHAIGLVPSGDRSFYLRISGFENLVFFGRLQGLRRRAAGARALEVLAQVGLGDAARRPVGTYSHGMQKRLGVARALLTAPAVLLVDEATHDLDPEGAISIRALVRDAANAGAAVVWATQRVEEIKDFADGVTVLDHGCVRFDGSVAGLLAAAEPRRYVLELRNGAPADRDLELRLQGRLEGVGSILRRPAAPPDNFVLALSGEAVLGDALSLLLASDVTVVSCRQELSEVEEAFMALVAERP